MNGFVGERNSLRIRIGSNSSDDVELENSRYRVTSDVIKCRCYASVRNDLPD